MVQPLWKEYLAVSLKMEHSPLLGLLRIYPREEKACIYENPKCPSKWPRTGLIRNWINKLQDSHTMECYSAPGRNELPIEAPI